MIIAIDGIDGTGKGTLAKILEEYFAEKEFKVKVISFPIYNSFFGKMISDYLNGNYGSLYTVNPKLASLLYAQDRQYYLKDLSILPDEIIIFDRYVNSNIAHHSSKINEKERKPFIEWIIELEYSVNKIPKPDISFILDLEVEYSIANVAKKRKREYTESTYDLHEANKEYLAETRKIFLSLANGVDTHLIRCDTNKIMKNPHDIANEIVAYIDSLRKDREFAADDCEVLG
jgi:dTMP kinase